MIRILLVALALSLVACQSSTPVPTQAPDPYDDTRGLKNIIPTAEKDRAPSNPKDVSNVADAVPKYEPRTAAGNKSPYKVKGVVYRVMDDPRGYSQYGIASWYGEKFHGNRTSNGEVYDMYAMTGAHKTLPIPSYVRVTNVENSKSIVVRINDRGPFAHGRVIDLSYAGAQKLGYAHAGTAKVKVEYIDPLASSHQAGSKNHVPSHSGQTVTTETVSALVSPAPQRYLQLAAFSDPKAAEAMKFQAATKTQWPVTVEKGLLPTGIGIYRVYLGPLPDEAALNSEKQSLTQQGFSEPMRVLK